jgi:hypothetical protein
LQAKLSPVGINATVVPPSPPPVNPAPPSGSAARKEAKQRQAATAKSEEGASEVAQSDNAGDLANRPPAAHGNEMTRIEHPFTRLEPPSAWAQDAQYAGGLALAALVLSLGWGAVGPRARRRQPRAPAAAWSPTRRR